jgi:aryl-alcohol dehydrogenase-like predicted oxidoreductase
MTPPLHRRDFLAQATAATAALTAAGAARAAGSRLDLPESAVAKRTLGKSGIQVSLVGMGTGSVGVGQASNQTRLGVKEFTKVVRHAIDRGIGFFDVADQYGSHTYLREALKGVPREKYVIQTKTHATDVANCRSHLERYRMELGVDCLDIVLLHCMQKADWPRENAGAMEYLMKAREEGIVRAHGTSCHGMDPLRTAAKHPFVQVDLARINPEGLIMDDKSPDEVASELQEMHDAGKGVVGMKILGEGRINTPERMDKSLRFVLGLGTVDAFIIGFESTEQVDDLLKRTEDAIADLKG